MKEEIVSLIDHAMVSIIELENYLFNNLKEKYIISKGILDEHKEHIEKIRGILEYDLTAEEIELAKKDLNFIIETIKNGKNGLSYPVEDIIANENITESTQAGAETKSDELDFNIDDIDSLLKALDENHFETTFPKEDVPTSNIDSLITELDGVNQTSESISTPEAQNITETFAQVSSDAEALASQINEQKMETLTPQQQVPEASIPAMEQQSIVETPISESFVTPMEVEENNLNEVLTQDYSADLDINALDEFLKADSENTDAQDAFRL